jgi:hypothetical protein
MFGSGLMVSVVLAVDRQPTASTTETVYKVVLVGVAIGLGTVGLLRPATGLQE